MVRVFIILCISLVIQCSHSTAQVEEPTGQKVVQALLAG